MIIIGNKKRILRGKIMAELCKKCFIEAFHPYIEDISTIEEDIVMSEECEICEGCGDCVPYVHHLGKDISCKEYDEIMNRIADEFVKLGSNCHF